MRVALICVGRMKPGPERELFDRYVARIAGFGRSLGVTGPDVKEIPESRARRPEDRREEEGRAILQAVDPRAALVALDERGASLTSEQWAADVGRARDAGASAYAIVIGGPDGLAPMVRERADKTISFGAMTWPHQLVRAMAAEQIYRSLSILAGLPYHRA
jgi:23S rRNA (pseudouridine1915-N3)-methyltransferase